MLWNKVDIFGYMYHSLKESFENKSYFSGILYLNPVEETSSQSKHVQVKKWEGNFIICMMLVLKKIVTKKMKLLMEVLLAQRLGFGLSNSFR